MRKMIYIVAALCAGFVLRVATEPALPARSIPPSTTDSEVADLIARLAPLSKKPDGEWYETGLEIRFLGRRRVRIDLKTPDGDEYHGTAFSLQEAAKRITEPSTRIKEALEGWAK